VVSVVGNLAVLQIVVNLVKNLVSEWAAWRSWCRNAETVTDPPFVEHEGGSAIVRESQKGGGKKNEQNCRLEETHLCVEVSDDNGGKSKKVNRRRISSHKCLA
jgi:hypothetical protein